MRKGENIRKRKDGRWEARCFNKENAKYLSIYAKSYTEVKEKLKNANHTNKKQYSINELTIEKSFVLWLDDIRATVKKSTYAKYHDMVYKHILPDIGDLKLKNITQDIIDAFIKKKLSNGRIDGSGGLSTKSVIDICNVLKQCLKIHNLIFDYKLPTTVQKEMRFLSDTEYTKLINYLLLDTNCEKLGILIALLCGIRLGELCALQWENIDFDNGTLSICKTVQRIVNVDVLSDTKTIVIMDTPKSQKSVRTIPLQAILLDKLNKMKQNDKKYILTGRYNYMEPRLLQNQFKMHLKKCSINDINFHALRHTFATKCVEKGFDIKSLSEILGHTDVKFTIDRYVHSTLQQKRIQMEKLTLSI